MRCNASLQTAGTPHQKPCQQTEGEPVDEQRHILCAMQ
jgi:hypothetical protein